MPSSTGCLWPIAILLLSNKAIGNVGGDCDIPTSLSFLNFNPVNSTEERYLLSCIQKGKKLYPLGEFSDVVCEENVWKTRDATHHVFHLTDLKCLLMCTEPKIPNGNYRVTYASLENGHGLRISVEYGGELFYIPGTVLQLTCDEGNKLMPSESTTTCGEDGLWVPPIPVCLDKDTTTSNRLEGGASVNPKNTMIIATTISVAAFLICGAIMVAIAIRAKWRVVCRKRRAPPSHPDDINYPHGYTQLGSGSHLPSYDEALDYEEDDFRPSSNLSGGYSSHRPTPMADYQQLSSLESSSRDESLSMSALSQSHRHSIFSGNSGHCRAPGGDNMSDILQGDHLSMSDTSTLVTVNTYESNHTASTPSLTHSRRGVAGSMNSNGITSTDDAPLIVRGADEDDGVGDGPPVSKSHC